MQGDEVAEIMNALAGHSPNVAAVQMSAYDQKQYIIKNIDRLNYEEKITFAKVIETYAKTLPPQSSEGMVAYLDNYNDDVIGHLYKLVLFYVDP